MLEVFLSLIGIGHANAKRAEDRRLNAASILSGIETTIMETALQLNYEISRLSAAAASVSVPPDMAVATLVAMREQCNQLQEMVETNRLLLSTKGADANVINELQRWAGTCSLIPKQVTLVVKQIELALDNVAR